MQFCRGSCFIGRIQFLLQAELGKPSVSHPDRGKVYIYVECSPTAEPSFEVVYMDSVYFRVFVYLFRSFVRKFGSSTNLISFCTFYIRE